MITAIATAVRHHSQMHRRLLKEISHIRLQENSDAQIHSATESLLARPEYSERDMDAALDALEALASCPECRRHVDNAFIVDIAAHAITSPRHTSRLAKIFPEHPTVHLLVATLSTNLSVFARSSTATQIISLAPFVKDATVLARFVILLKSHVSPVAGRLETLRLVPFDEHLNTLDDPDTRALCSVEGWDIKSTVPPGSCVPRLWSPRPCGDVPFVFPSRRCSARRVRGGCLVPCWCPESNLGC